MDKPVQGEETRAMGKKKNERIQRGGPSEQQMAFNNTGNRINNSGSCTTMDHSNNTTVTCNIQINYISAEPYTSPQQPQPLFQQLQPQSQPLFQQLQPQPQPLFQQLQPQAQGVWVWV
ncbi:unnamed protein product [Rotaria socialis]|uniref:Uncharacterized protein n=1 Tax=Rotaria socialis TaxID=392032 RepID=A0A821E101_9BILA|nr:unnamed protein product [Rotaria socialis]CAF4629853.1 unnamed protein product [Rotaria socialis]